MAHSGDFHERRVVCIRDGLLDNNLSYTGLVIGKIYTIEIRRNNLGDVFNKKSEVKSTIEYKLSGVFGWIDSSWFLSIDEWRDKQLNNILDE